MLTASLLQKDCKSLDSGSGLRVPNSRKYLVGGNTNKGRVPNTRKNLVGGNTNKGRASGTYTVTVTGANGCTKTQSQSITLTPSPIVNISAAPNDTICTGNPVALTASGGTAYLWSGGITNGTAFTPASSSTYTVTVTGANGCTKVQTQLVTLNPLPTISISAIPNDTICAGTSLSLTASGGSTYSWSGGITNGTSFTPAVNGTYTVTVTGVNGCTKMQTQHVALKPSPTISITSLPNDTVCSGVSVTLTATGASTYSWNGSLLNGIPFVPSATNTYTVVGTASNGCTRSKTQIVKVNSLPSVNALNASGCDGNAIYLSGTPSGGIFSVPNPYVGPSTTFTYTYTDLNGCSATTPSKAITIVSCTNTTMNFKCYIQGFYLGSGFMRPALLNQGIGASSSLTDSVDIELHESIAPYLLKARRRVVLSTSGNASASFANTSGNYYLVLKHRNAIETWSATPIAFGTASYDFTTAANKAYGSNQVLVSPGKWAFYSGDINQDENIDLGDMFLIETDISNYQFGYFSTDINGDGNVDLLDQAPVENNINNFIYSIHP